jgi:hypothetical protein
MKVSLCILACNNSAGVKKLVSSVKSFSNLDVEVVVGDNSTIKEESETLKLLSDLYLRVEDHDLWFEGFAACKTKIIWYSSNNVVLIGDPDEVWGETLYSRLIESNNPILRTWLIHSDEIDTGNVVSHGRVFDKKKAKLLGRIHEEPYLRKGMKHWSEVAPSKPFAIIKHSPRIDEDYLSRKNVLYDNIIHRAYLNHNQRHGINEWWFNVYWPRRLKEGFIPTTFEEWREDVRRKD